MFEHNPTALQSHQQAQVGQIRLFSRGFLSLTSFLSAELEREIHVFFSSFLISGPSYAAHDVRVRRLPRRAVREMASHLKVHAILSKWPLTQYCMNLKMANQRFASAAPPPLSPPRLPPQGQQRSRPCVPETQQPQP